MLVSLHACALGARTPPHGPQAMVPEQVSHCVSTAVNLKSAWCDTACTSAELKCPAACLCVAVPGNSVRFARLSQTILMRLARKLRNTPAADRPTEMETAKAAAASAFKALTSKEEGGCTSIDSKKVADDWCETICRASSAESSVCGMCVCEQTSDAWSSQRQQQEEEEQHQHQQRQRLPVQPRAEHAAWTVGYWSWSWAPNNGTENATLGVQLSGEVNVTAALRVVGAIPMPCGDRQREFCDAQVQFYESEGKSTVHAEQLVMQDFTSRCRSCLTGADEGLSFSVESGRHRGAQFLALGGGRSEVAWNVDTLSGFVEGGQDLEAIKDAGFAGVCFDIEETSGDRELILAFERAFAALRQAGLEVMVSTSHSAPYHARTSSNEARAAPSLLEEFRRVVAFKTSLVESWVNSDDVGYISPQLFVDAAGGLDLQPTAGVGYELYKHAKPRFVPSIVSAEHTENVKQFFAAMGVRVDGVIQWQHEARNHSSAHRAAAEGARKGARSAGRGARSAADRHGQVDADSPCTSAHDCAPVIYSRAPVADNAVDADADTNEGAEKPAARKCVMWSTTANDYWDDETCTSNCAIGTCPMMICKCE